MTELHLVDDVELAPWWDDDHLAPEDEDDEPRPARRNQPGMWADLWALLTCTPFGAGFSWGVMAGVVLAAAAFDI